MNVDEKVGRNIRKYRMAYNMTLKELAVRLHKSVSTVSKYEKGDISLDISTFLELSKIFKVSLLQLSEMRLLRKRKNVLMWRRLKNCTCTAMTGLEK